MRSAGFLAVLVALVAAAVVFAETQSYLQVMDNGKVDWIRGKVYVVGEGVPLRDAVGGQKRTTARIAARQLALRKPPALSPELPSAARRDGGLGAFQRPDPVGGGRTSRPAPLTRQPAPADAGAGLHRPRLECRGGGVPAGDGDPLAGARPA